MGKGDGYVNPNIITSVRGRRVWDSRGRPTVEVEIGLAGGKTGRAIAPAGASTGTGEALDLRDGGEPFGGYGVQKALANINGEIRLTIAGLDARDGAEIDRILIDLDGTPNKSRLGGNAIIAVSLALLHAAAAAADEPLWRYLGGDGAKTIPLPEIQIFGGGAHASTRIDIQDFMVTMPGASSFDEAMVWTAEVYRKAGEIMADSGRLRGVADEGGFWPVFETNEEGLGLLVQAIEKAGLVPGEQAAIALDIAATEFGKNGRYKLALEERELDSDGLCELLIGWIDRYPIISIEDPLGEDDVEGTRRFTEAVGDRVQIVGDDYVVTDASRIKEAAKLGACNAALIKPNQAGTVSETKAAVDAAKEAGWGAIVSARSGETEDVSIVHLAIGWGVSQLKVGAFSRAERMAKWNEALRIEELLGEDARFPGNAPFERFGQ
jgi:enolase 1/2/3